MSGIKRSIYSLPALRLAKKKHDRLLINTGHLVVRLSQTVVPASADRSDTPLRLMFFSGWRDATGCFMYAARSYSRYRSS